MAEIFNSRMSCIPLRYLNRDDDDDDRDDGACPPQAQVHILADTRADHRTADILEEDSIH